MNQFKFVKMNICKERQLKTAKISSLQGTKVVKTKSLPEVNEHVPREQMGLRS